MKKLSAEIYTPSYGNCSNGGISARYGSVMCYFLEDGETIEDIKDYEDNAVIFIPRMLWGKKHYLFEPLAPTKKGYTSYMMGGCYVGSSDSRFSEYTDGFDILPLHDRSDTWEMYYAMTR